MYLCDRRRGEALAVKARKTGIERPAEILLDDAASATSPQEVADRLLSSMRNDPLALADGTPLGITASVGVVLFAGGMAKAEQFLKDADNAMYEAKRAGRNRVCPVRLCS